MPVILKVGRYKIEHELGAGGMGVVYAAFDPELERTVALKVIRGLADGAEQRLLREARAMARLAHPNVVTVYEVGTAEGRDYIAMELIDGGNLSDWLKSQKPPVAEVIQAFVAAGRGLATAHEVGLVHRDFKPHNVLRSKRGRVMVTDFGLARESTTSAPASRHSPMPVSTLSGLTVPGSLVGTPAYMAPEQWNGGEVTAATDQFAFCVALWEGLAGERPFKGETADELRAQIEAGPAALDGGKLPRRLRSVLMRGLEIDPAKRWLSMNTLLARLEPRRRSLALGAAGAIACALAIALFVETRHHEPHCEAPTLNPASVWNWTLDVPIRAGSKGAAELLAGTFRRWQDVRGQVCRDVSPARTPRLGCLDRVLTRIDAMRQIRAMDPSAPMWGIVSQGYEADVCLRPDPPRLPPHYTEAALVGLAVRGGANVPKPTIARAESDLAHDDCARAYFDFRSPTLYEESEHAAQVCGDDQAATTSLMNLIAVRLGDFPDASAATQIAAVERAIDHAAQPFLTRQYAKWRAIIALRLGDLDTAIAMLQTSLGGPIEEFAREMKLRLLQELVVRSGPGDLASARALATPSEPPFEIYDATIRWFQGENTARQLATLSTQMIATLVPDGPPLHGIVVDDKGAPVAGASVYAGPTLRGDAATPALALANADGSFPLALATTTTDSYGRFTFARTFAGSSVVAQAGTDRSGTSTATESRLVLHPTITVHGSVALPLPAGQVYVEARVPGDAYPILAPVLTDGSFTLGGVPAGFEIRIANVRADRTSYTATIVATTPLALPTLATRTLEVALHSTAAFELATVTVVGGDPIHPRTVGELDAITKTRASAAADAHGPTIQLRGVPAGMVTACVTALHADRDDPNFLAKYVAQQAEQPVACAVVDAAATAIKLEVPPMKRVN